MTEATGREPPVGAAPVSLDALLDDQSRRWLAGDRHLVEAYLTQQPGLHDDTEVLLALLYHEVLLREHNGETLQPEEYRVRFPHLADALHRRIEVHRAIANTVRGAPRPVAMTTAAQLLALLRDGRLLEPAHLDETARDLQIRFPEARALAGELVRRGWLTPYQANQLFLGRAAALTLGGYLLLERLGEGGMGQVFKARHHKLGRVVALKVMRAERIGPDMVRRFQREIRATAKLSHPAIVHAYDAGEVGGVLFFTMEYVEGTDLKKLVRLAGPLPVHKACDFMRQAALALQHAHERGLIHRDVKPANLLLTAAGVVKLLDLGLARLEHGPAAEESSTLTHEGEVMGTPDFMAPEQTLESHSADIRADLYSLGGTLYFLLTGSVPFPGGSVGEKLVKHQLREPEPLEALRPEVPEELAAVVRKLMAKRPEDRYQTPAEAAAALEEFSGTGRSTASPFANLDVGQETLSRLRRAQRRWLLGGAGLVAVLVLGGVLAVLWHSGTPPSSGQTDPFRPTAAEDRTPPEFRALMDRVRNPQADKEQLRLDLLEYRRTHVGAPEVLVAARVLRELPSPLDKLASSNAGPEPARADPRDAVVQVLGDERGRHWGGVRCVAFSPDGQLAVSGGADMVVYVWEIPDLRQRAAFKGHVSAVRVVAFAAEGREVVSSSDDGTVRRWNVGSGKEVSQVMATAACCSADGQRALCSGEKVMKLFEVDGGKVLQRFEGHTDAVVSAAFSPDGRRALSGSKDKTMRLWNVDTGEQLRKFDDYVQSVESVAFSADGERVISGGGYVPLRQWDAETGKELPVPSGGSWTVVGCPDHPRRALYAASQAFYLWDLDTGKTVRNFAGHGGVVRGLSSSAARRYVLSGGDDRSLRLWDVDSGKELSPPERQSLYCTGVALSPDGRLAVTGGQGKDPGRLWDVESGKELFRFGPSGATYSVAFSPDGAGALTADYDNTVRLWDVKTGKEVRHFSGHAGQVTTVTFTPDGKRALSGSADGTVRVWEVATGRELLQLKHGSRIADNGLSVSPDGQRILSGGGDKCVRLWDANTGEELGLFKKAIGWAHGNPFAADGRHAVFPGSTIGAPQIVDLNKDPLEPIPLQHAARVNAVAVSPDGTTVATASEDGKVILWNLSGKRLWERQLPGWVDCLAFASDSRHLATANANGTAYVLRLP